MTCVGVVVQNHTKLTERARIAVELRHMHAADDDAGSSREGPDARDMRCRARAVFRSVPLLVNCASTLLYLPRSHVTSASSSSCEIKMIPMRVIYLLHVISACKN
jgi:hypothetical protein